MEYDSSTSKPTSPISAALTLTHTPFTPEITTDKYPVIVVTCPGASYSSIDPPLYTTCQAKITTAKHAVQLSQCRTIVTCSSTVSLNIHILFNNAFLFPLLSICPVLLGQDFILSTNFKVIGIPFDPGTTTSEIPSY